VAPDPFLECRRSIAAHSKSFDLASRLFPAERRNEVAALYAWCRDCDDAIDLAPASSHDDALARLRARLDDVYAGKPMPDAILRCFQIVVVRRRIPIEYPRGLLDGLAMDAAGARYRGVDDLLHYCWQVAGTVGLMMCHVMGVSDGRAAPHAAHLGIGMQLTNVCRDVLEDWGRSRLYLPGELLGPEADERLRAGLEAGCALTLEDRPALASAVHALLALAERYYASADAGLAFLEPRSALAVRTARLVYAEIGRRIETRGCDPLRGRAVVPAARKLRLLAGALVRFAAEQRAWRAPPLSAPSTVLSASEAVRLA